MPRALLHAPYNPGKINRTMFYGRFAAHSLEALW
jgi:hypothetical protein